MLRKVIRITGKAWKMMGEPFPDTARYLRHTLLEMKSRPKMVPMRREVAVIILSHNYGSMLARAIESVLRQTVPPAEILVVDDASSDNTRTVAESYAHKGVSYLRVENRNLSLTRNSGARATRAEFLLYLDADDFLPDHYIERCLECMRDPSTGFAYGNIQQFGDWNTFIEVPGFDAYILSQQNYVTSNALLRRQMFDLAGGYTPLPHSFEDWEFLRRCVALGYTGRKADTWVHYNMHADSLSSVYINSPHRSYANDAALLHQPLTVFTPFCGRHSVFTHYLEGLLSSDIDPKMVHLWWYNTSTDPSFDALLRRTLPTLPFASVRYTHAPLPENWAYDAHSLQMQHEKNNDDAEYHYQLAVLRAYNTMIQECPTDFVLTLEDDMKLDAGTIKAMLQTMDASIAAVISPYRHRTMQRYEVWMPAENGGTTHFTQQGEGAQDVGGCGFGCTLFRTRALKRLAPLSTGIRQNPKQWYDQLAYLRLKQQGRIVCNWNLETAHLKS